MYLNEIFTVGKRRKNKIVFHRFLQYFLIDRSAKAKAKAPKWLPSIPSVDLDTRNVSLEIVHDITCCKGGERERERSGNLNNLPIHAKYTYTTAPPACLPAYSLSCKTNHKSHICCFVAMNKLQPNRQTGKHEFYLLCAI